MSDGGTSEKSRAVDEATIREIVRQWIGKAEQGIASAEALLSQDPPLLYPSCFHAQQAAEKYLRALLTWHQIEFPKTHAIERLLDLMKDAEPETASGLRDAVALTSYGVDGVLPKYSFRVVLHKRLYGRDKSRPYIAYFAKYCILTT